MTKVIGMVRQYGPPPFEAAVLHGGPGAAGTAACIARRLANRAGILEPLQAAKSVQGQIEELDQQLKQYVSAPVTLVGHSWGAWLAVLYASAHPHLVKQLVLVGAGPFEEAYVPQILQRRMDNLAKEDAENFRQTLNELKRGNGEVMERLGMLVEKTDNVCVIPGETKKQDVLPADGTVYQAVWPEAELLRRKGELINAIRKITVPITILHGENDPHPPEGVIQPLKTAGIQHRAVIFPRCGHSPFQEQYAIERFYKVLTELITG